MSASHLYQSAACNLSIFDDNRRILSFMLVHTLLQCSVVKHDHNSFLRFTFGT